MPFACIFSYNQSTTVALVMFLSRPPASSTGSRFTRRKGKSFSTIDDGIMDYFKARKAKLDKNTIETEDPKRMFLLSLLPDMKAMSDSQTRTFKRRVLALVDEILEEPQRPSLAPSQQATSSYNLETQSVFVSTQELPSLNEQQSTAAYNFETQHVSLSTQEQMDVPNGQRVTPAYNQILTYYESVPSLINTDDD